MTKARLVAALGAAFHLSLGCHGHEISLVATDPDSRAQSIVSLHFDTDCEGWAIASPSAGLYRTIDGGRTWKAVSVGPRSYLSFVARGPMRGVWVGGTEGTMADAESEEDPLRSVMFESTDGGTSWRRMPIGVGKGVREMAVCGRAVWAMGGDFIARSDDGGQAWKAVLEPRAELIDIACDGEQTAIAATTKGTIHVTQDGGRSWQLRRVAAKEFLSGIARAGRDWWAVGLKGAIFTSADGGQTWRRTDTAGAGLFKLRTKDEHGWMAGGEGLILALDAGKWRRLSGVTDVGLVAIAISGDGRGAWVGGENMTVVRVGDSSSCRAGQSTAETVYIWIPLLNEGTVVSRPTKAEVVGGGLYRVLATPDYDPQHEEWAYLPGSVVLGELTTSDHGRRYLLATALVTP